MVWAWDQGMEQFVECLLDVGNPVTEPLGCGGLSHSKSYVSFLH